MKTLNAINCIFFYLTETWILYRGSGYEVSKLVENAYQHYENLEFGIESVDISDPRRHIKLINISGEKVYLYIIHKYIH